MKNLFVRMTLLAAAVVLASCKDETPGYAAPDAESPAGATAVGYLAMPASGLSVLLDSDTDRDTDLPTTRAGETDARTGVPQGSDVAVDAADPEAALRSFMMKITSEKGDVVFHDTYAALQGAMGELGLEVPVGIYTVEATSSQDKTQSRPAAVQARPSYAGSSAGCEVTKAALTRVDPIMCKLQNIKVTIEVDASLFESLIPLSESADPEDDYPEGQLIDARVYYSNSPAVSWNVPADWDWTADDPAPVYFPTLNETGANTLQLHFKALLKEEPSRLPIAITRNISGILKGQWRRIKLIPNYSTEGGLTFDVQVDAFVQDEEIVVGDSPDAELTAGWKELAYVDPNDPSMAAPAMKWADGRDLPATIEAGSDLQPVVLAVPNGLERLSLTFSTTNPDFEAEAAALTLADLCSVGAHHALLTAYGMPYGTTLRGQQEIRFGFDAIAEQILGHEGTYTFTFGVTDQAGCTLTQTVVFVSGSGVAPSKAPSITWATGTLYDDNGYNADGTPRAGAPFEVMYEGMNIVLELLVGSHFESISLTITSQTLNADLLSAAGLATTFDLCDLQDFEYDGDTYTAENQADVLINKLELIDRVNDDLKRSSTAAFDITGFVEILNVLGANEKFQFALTVTDAEGRSVTKYLRLQNPAE